MIEIGRRVSILYEGRLEDGSVFDSSEMHEGNPLVFVVGAGTVIPGLEKEVCKLEPFMKKTVSIPADQAYGDYDPELKERVPSRSFPNWEKLPVGGYIVLDMGDERRRVRIESADENTIVFDFNHEFAGHDLTFDLEVIDVFGETGSLIENEEHSSGCTCGCHKLKEQLADDRSS